MSLSKFHTAVRAEIRATAETQDLRELSDAERRAFRAMQRRLRAAAKSTKAGAPNALPTGFWV